MVIPAPAAQPGTAATTGTGHVDQRREEPWNVLGEAADVRAPVLGARRTRCTSPPVQKLGAVADHSDGADLGRIGAVQRVGDEGQRVAVERAVAAPRDAQPQHPPLADDGVAHAPPR